MKVKFVAKYNVSTYNNYWYYSKWQQANSTFVEIKI